MESTEQNLFALMLCEISKVVGYNKKLKENEDEKLIPHHFSFTELDICNLFNCSRDNLRKTLEPSAKRLTKIEVGTSGKWGFDYFSPIYRVKYERAGKFEMYMGKEIAYMIANSTIMNFSEIDLKHFIQLKGKHSKRIFKKLNQWKTSSYNEELILSFNQLRKLLGVDNKYKNKQHFRKYCIKNPIQEIVTKLSDTWRPLDKKNKGYELVKTGRTYSHIKFRLKYVTKKKDSPINSDDAEDNKLERVYNYQSCQSNNYQLTGKHNPLKTL